MKMHKQSIAIDLDEVLNNLHEVWLDQYNNDFNDNLKSTDIHSWEICNYIKPEARNHMFDYLLKPNFFLNLKCQPHSQEVTKWLSQYFDLYIVTAYQYQVCRDKAEWVSKHYPHIDIKNIIFCNNKGLIKTDYLIDDGGHNCEAFTGISLLFNSSHNQYLKDKYKRVNNWLDIKEYFEEVINHNLPS